MLDFQEISRYRENNRIEAKKAVGGFPHSLWETYSAFANTLGGVILLGVEERTDKSFHPVKLPDPQWLVDTFWQQVNDTKIVSANILESDYVQITEAEGEQIVVIEVPRASRRQRPVYIGSSIFQGTYQRTGEGDYRCEHSEVERMLQQREQISFDMERLDCFLLEDLDPGSVQRYLTLYKERRAEQCQQKKNIDLLQELGVLENDAVGQLHPTRSGLLLLGKHNAIKQAFPGYFLTYRERAQGELCWRIAITTKNESWNGNLFEFYFFTLQKVTDYVATLTLSEEEQHAVQLSFQEGLANGLIHANYEGKRGIVVSRQHRAIVISNPGSLQIEAAQLIQNSLSIPRNELLMQLFHHIGIGRGTGSGLPTIAAVWKQQGWIAPKLEDYLAIGNTVLTLIFSSDEKNVIQEMQQEMLVDYITAHITVSLFDVSDVLQIGLSAARAILQALLQKNIIEPDGERYRLKA